MASGGGLKSLSSSLNNLSSSPQNNQTQNTENLDLEDPETQPTSTSITTISKKVITKSNVSVSDFVNRMDKKFNNYGVSRANLPDSSLAKSVQSKGSKSNSPGFSPMASPKFTNKSDNNSFAMKKSLSASSVNKIGSGGGGNVGSNRFGSGNSNSAFNSPYNSPEPVRRNNADLEGSNGKYESTSNLNKYRG